MPEFLTTKNYEGLTLSQVVVVQIVLSMFFVDFCVQTKYTVNNCTAQPNFPVSFKVGPSTMLLTTSVV